MIVGKTLEQSLVEVGEEEQISAFKRKLALHRDNLRREEQKAKRLLDEELERCKKHENAMEKARAAWRKRDR